MRNVTVWHWSVFLLLVITFLISTIFTASASSRKLSQQEADDMVVLQQQGDREVIEQLKTLLGKRLGLPLRHYQALDRRIPLCLLDLYLEQHVFRSLARDALGYNVRCFTSKGSVPTLDKASTANMNGFKFLHFNLSDIPANELVSRAELRLSRSKRSTRRPPKASGSRPTAPLSSSTVNTSSQQYHQQQQTQLYELTSLHSSSTLYALSPLPAKLHTHRSVPWEAYDVTDLVRKWREEPSLNIGLALRVDGGGRQAAAAGVTAAPRRRRKQRRGMRTIRQPVLVTYGDNGEGGQLLMATNRSTRRIRRRRSGKKHSAANPSSAHHYQQQKDRAKNQCKRRPLNISFREIGWDDWILAPKSYKAFYCDGVCPTYLRDSMNATNHAIVQSFVHSVSPELATPPCCVPTELSPITILYVDEFEKVVLKTYNDMVVVGCGCR